MRDSNRTGLSDRRQGWGSRVAPAVGMLLLNDSVFAGDDSPPPVAVPEPGILGLLAISAVAGGAVAYVRRRRRDK